MVRRVLAQLDVLSGSSFLYDPAVSCPPPLSDVSEQE